MNNYNTPEKHLKHEVYIQLGPFGPHRAKVMCKICNKFVKWATIQEVKELTNERNKL